MARVAAVGSLILTLAACSLSTARSTARSAPSRAGLNVDASRGAVVSVCPIASEVGAEVLERGGNAVDAAIATAFALAVTWPEAGNIGGGGFLLHRAADGERSFVDYRERAPGSATPDLFLDETGEVDPYHVRRGFRPVGVPGTVAGMALAHQKFGSRPWDELVRPAVLLAREGFVISRSLEASIEGAVEDLAEDPEASRIFLDQTGRPRRAGSVLVQSDLADSLARIEAGGAAGFYRSVTAERIVKASQAAGGPHAMSDFEAYQAVIREPLVGHYRGYEVLAGPPPTSGGQILIGSLNILEGYDLASLGAGSAEELHLLGEALRRSFVDRALHLGDPDFVTVPIDRLISKEHAERWRESIDPSRATPSDDIAGDLAGTLEDESPSTTHFSVVDRFGNAVANTYTLEESWGSKMVAPGTGIVLNNEIHDFNVQPGTSTRKGRFGTAPNTIRPYKRPLSSMCPVIVARDGELRLVTGSPGGRTIPSTVLRIVTATIDHAMSPADAARIPRIHHGLYPDELRVEESLDSGEIEALRAMGHVVQTREKQGDGHTVGIEPDTGALVGAADHRRQGGAAAPRK